MEWLSYSQATTLSLLCVLGSCCFCIPGGAKGEQSKASLTHYPCPYHFHAPATPYHQLLVPDLTMVKNYGKGDCGSKTDIPLLPFSS